MFQDKIVVITGGVQGIGKCIADEFLKEGAMVCVIDKQPGLVILQGIWLMKEPFLHLRKR